MKTNSALKRSAKGRLYLSWFSVQGARGTHVGSSPHEIDQLHLQYWEKCVDQSSPQEVLDHFVSFVPGLIAQAIANRNAA